MLLIKAYPKDISLIIEIPLKEAEMFLDYLEKCQCVYDSSKEPEFETVIDKANEIIKSLNEMCDSVRNYHDA